MTLKALARFLYATVPGLAAVRFAAKDLTAPYIFKPEYRGVSALSIGRGLIIDIGANRGQSIAVFKRLAPDARIVAFEPEQRSAVRVASRYQRDPTITVHSCALGQRPGLVTFFVPSYGRWDCDGMPATDRQAATAWLSDPGRMLHFDEAKLVVREVPTECRTLDSFELSPRLVKLHAQGAELDILKGSRDTISRHKPALMCAFPPPAVNELLAGWGYRPYLYCDGRFAAGVAPPPATFTWYLAEGPSFEGNAGDGRARREAAEHSHDARS